MAAGRAAGNAWRLVSQYRGAGSVKLIGQRSKTPPVMYFYGASVDTWLPDNLLGPPSYGKELFSVQLRFEGDSGRFSGLRDQGLKGYTEKI